MNNAPVPPTHSDLLNGNPADRIALVERYALEVLESSRPPGSKPLDGASRLADAGMDSLQAAELKFALDELTGHESDVELFVSNPTVRQLAESIVRAAGL
jgi:hypothetical protein